MMMMMMKETKTTARRWTRSVMEEKMMKGGACSNEEYARVCRAVWLTMGLEYVARVKSALRYAHAGRRWLEVVEHWERG